jgi:hypothetical protein
MSPTRSSRFSAQTDIVVVRSSSVATGSGASGPREDDEAFVIE